MAEPFFIVGAERSGTTLLRLMLDHHGALAVPHEFDFAAEALDDEGRVPDREALHAFLQGHASFRRSGLVLDDAREPADQLRDLLEQRRGDAERIGMSVHRHFPRLLHLWPEARFVHLLRDPRDVARSVVQMGWAGNSWAGVQPWIDAETAWDTLAERLPEGHAHELRYEDLVREPEAELARVCAFLGVAYDPGMLRYPEDSAYGPPDPALASRWQGRIDPDEQAWIEHRAGALLAARGYAPGPPRTPGPWTRLGLRLGDRLGRMRFRLGRYGPALVAEDVVSRRVGATAWQQKVRARMIAAAEERIR
jgi:hypothetical protein